VSERLVTHPDVGAIVLTGSYETAELFAQLAPRTPLFAETSGKNAIVVMPDADLDLAAADLVKSAFGHAGQKCSAASLAILVGDVATSARFRRQLVDATRSLAVGPSTNPSSLVGPLIGPPAGKLLRALTTLEPGQRWLLEPRRIGDRLWTPGILDGVEPGSWFHVTECFGPVLGLMAADDLDAAVAMQNAVPFGLTGGIHSLDPALCATWLDGVEVGNAYVNRGITGAIVRRQPFGGWKRSSVGPGAKAGGPNYVSELGRWSNAGTPSRRAEPSPAIAALAASFDLSTADRLLLDAAVGSDAYWWEHEFAVEHDPSALFCESNVFRYRPLPSMVVRVTADARPLDVARVVCAATRSGTRFTVWADTAYAGRLSAGRSSATDFARQMRAEPPGRLRLVGSAERPLGDLPTEAYVDRRAPVLDGRVELARYLREQSVSTTLHRFGNLVRDADRAFETRR
jgi:RHH-type proline utilization regulon transcriptional repressor/proline dehydrogenase/delta 1-pyrroline-5-carboxylate dehydrogenase